jgi:hypothetical protein
MQARRSIPKMCARALRYSTAIFPKRDLLHGHCLCTICVLPQLVHVQHEDVPLYLSYVSIMFAPLRPQSQGGRLWGRILTSINTKLGVGSSSSLHHPVVIAPVALPGFTKNLPSISYASNLCVPPHSSTSTSIWRAAISKLSQSPGGTMVWPCVKPMRSEPWVTTFDKARLGASTSKSPFTICRSGAIPRRNSKVSLSVMLPRQRIWPIFPGARSFLNYNNTS